MSATSATETANDNTTPTALSPRRASILLVVEDALLSGSLRRYLAQASYEITEADNGTAALEHLKVVEPDGILCHTHMAEMSGYELYEQLPTHLQQRLLFVSGNHNRETETPVLFLPFEHKELFRALRDGPFLPRAREAAQDWLELLEQCKRRTR